MQFIGGMGDAGVVMQFGAVTAEAEAPWCSPPRGAEGRGPLPSTPLGRRPSFRKGRTLRSRVALVLVFPRVRFLGLDREVRKLDTRRPWRGRKSGRRLPPLRGGSGRGPPRVRLLGLSPTLRPPRSRLPASSIGCPAGWGGSRAVLRWLGGCGEERLRRRLLSGGPRVSRRVSPMPQKGAKTATGMRRRCTRVGLRGGVGGAKEEGGRH